MKNAILIILLIYTRNPSSRTAWNGVIFVWLKEYLILLLPLFIAVSPPWALVLKLICFSDLGFYIAISVVKCFYSAQLRTDVLLPTNGPLIRHCNEPFCHFFIYREKILYMQDTILTEHQVHWTLPTLI